MSNQNAIAYNIYGEDIHILRNGVEVNLDDFFPIGTQSAYSLAPGVEYSDHITGVDAAANALTIRLFALGFEFHHTTDASSTTAYGNWSESKYGAKAFSDAKIEDDFSFGDRVYTHLSGNNDALIPFVDGGPSHDIDLWTDVHINVAENKDGSSILSLKGDLAGDGFPSSEVFVTDKTGKNKIFLGVGAAKSGPNEGPFLTLMGDKKEKQFDIDVQIDVDKNGIFRGVYSVDKQGNKIIMTIADWNKTFENMDTK